MTTERKLDDIRDLLLPNFATGPAIKWREDEHGLRLIQAGVPGYAFERVMGILGFDVAMLKRLDDVERVKFEAYCEQNKPRNSLLTDDKE